jgi:hypothetical protein
MATPTEPIVEEDLTPRRARRVVQRLVDQDVAERSDVFFMNSHYDIEGLARKAYRSFGDEKSQINGLERTALSASTFGEVVNFVKSQMGRDTRVGDKWRTQGFGESMLAVLVGRGTSGDGLAGEGEGHAGRIIEALDDSVQDALRREDESKRDVERRLKQEVKRRLRLAYAQEYIGHVASHYKYLTSTQG